MKENKDSLKILEAMDQVQDQYLVQAHEKPARRRSPWIRITAVAACLCLLAGSVAVIKSGLFRQNPKEVPITVEGPVTEKDTEGIQTTAAIIPTVHYEGSAEQFLMGKDYQDWWQESSELWERSLAVQTGMDDYYRSLLPQLLNSEENAVCSPLNIYMALAMLAETSDGQTRSQLLDTLQAQDLETLRERVATIWQANQVDTPVLTSILADSLWLSNKHAYSQNILDILAERYHASSFSGEMGSQEMDQALRDWVNTNTNDLLKDYADNMSFDPSMVVRLVSTIYYKASWINPFNEAQTQQETFHGLKGDTTVDMMHSDTHAYYKGDTFTAVALPLSESGFMYFFLPEEGTALDSLYTNDQFFEVLKGENEDLMKFAQVNLSVPKFDVQQKTDLKDVLQNLGIVDAFDPQKADFSSFTAEPVFVSQADHAACVKIDEEGVTGAAYTDMAMAMGAPMQKEVVDFVLDRPFCYVVTSRDGSMLFAGTIQNIEG